MQLRARVVFRASCTARRRFFSPKSSSWSMRLRRRARDGRRAWDCRARDFDRVSGRRQQPRQCSARRCCGELQKSFAAAEASCTPLLLVLWTMGCVCVLGVVAARPGLIGVPWSPHKPTGKRGLDTELFGYRFSGNPSAGGQADRVPCQPWPLGGRISQILSLIASLTHGPFAAEGAGEAFRPPQSDCSPLGATR